MYWNLLEVKDNLETTGLINICKYLLFSLKVEEFQSTKTDNPYLMASLTIKSVVAYYSIKCTKLEMERLID